MASLCVGRSTTQLVVLLRLADSDKMELDPEGFQNVYPFARFVEGDVGTGKNQSHLQEPSTRSALSARSSTQVPHLLPPVLSIEENVSKRHWLEVCKIAVLKVLFPSSLHIFITQGLRLDTPTAEHGPTLLSPAAHPLSPIVP